MLSAEFLPVDQGGIPTAEELLEQPGGGHAELPGGGQLDYLVCQRSVMEARSAVDRIGREPVASGVLRRRSE
jgi:hypothetical protein